MPNNQEVIIYSFGFEFDGIMFCWKHKELYRMPYTRGTRSYEKRKLIQKKNGGSLSYSICGHPKSMSNLDEITKRIHYEEVVNIDDGCPF